MCARKLWVLLDMYVLALCVGIVLDFIPVCDLPRQVLEGLRLHNGRVDLVHACCVPCQVSRLRSVEIMLDLD